MNNTRISYLSSSPREVASLSPREISALVSLLDAEWWNLKLSIVLEHTLSSKGQFAGSKFVEVDRRGCTFTVVGAELGDVIIKWYHISQTTVVSIYRTLFTTTPQSSIYIVDHWDLLCKKIEYQPRHLNSTWISSDDSDIRRKGFYLQWRD